MIWGLFVLVALSAGLGVLMRKFSEDGYGTGLGRKNNEKWGMDEKQKYHD